MQTADQDARELQGTPAAIVNKLNGDAPRRSPSNAGLARHKTLEIAVIGAEENTLHQIAGFVNQSANFARR